MKANRTMTWRLLAAALVLAMALAGCSSGGAAPNDGSSGPAGGGQAAGGSGESWPAADDVLTYIVGFNPGGSGGAQALIAQPYLEQYLGCKVDIQYVPGAGGLLGFNRAYTMPSGYAIDWSNTIDGIWSFYHLSPTPVPWEIEDWKTLGAITNLMNQGLIVQNGSPWETFPDLIADARNRPSEIVIASNGPGRLEDLLIIEIMEYFDVRFNWVLYESSSTIQTDILTGDVHVGLVGINETFVDHPEFRVLTGLAVEYPDEWTLKDEFSSMRDWEEALGFVCEDLPAFRVPGNACWVVKADTPDHIYEALCAAVEKTATDPGWREQEMMYSVPTYIPPEEAQLIYDEVAEIYASYVELHKQYVPR